MKMKIIILILFCIIGFLCGWWVKTINNQINEPINIQCDGGICGPLSEYEKGRGD